MSSNTPDRFILEIPPAELYTFYAERVIGERLLSELGPIDAEILNDRRFSEMLGRYLCLNVPEDEALKGQNFQDLVTESGEDLSRQALGFRVKGFREKLEKLFRGVITKRGNQSSRRYFVDPEQAESLILTPADERKFVERAMRVAWFEMTEEVPEPLLLDRFILPETLSVLGIHEVDIARILEQMREELVEKVLGQLEQTLAPLEEITAPLGLIDLTRLGSAREQLMERMAMVQDSLSAAASEFDEPLTKFKRKPRPVLTASELDEQQVAAEKQRRAELFAQAEASLQEKLGEIQDPYLVAVLAGILDSFKGVPFGNTTITKALKPFLEFIPDFSITDRRKFSKMTNAAMEELVEIFAEVIVQTKPAPFPKHTVRDLEKLLSSGEEEEPEPEPELEHEVRLWSWSWAHISC